MCRDQRTLKQKCFQLSDELLMSCFSMMADCSTHVDLQHWSCVTETEWTLSSCEFGNFQHKISGNLF